MNEKIKTRITYLIISLLIIVLIFLIIFINNKFYRPDKFSEKITSINLNYIISIREDIDSLMKDSLLPDVFLNMEHFPKFLAKYSDNELLGYYDGRGNRALKIVNGGEQGVNVGDKSKNEKNKQNHMNLLSNNESYIILNNNFNPEGTMSIYLTKEYLRNLIDFILFKNIRDKVIGVLINIHTINDAEISGQVFMMFSRKMLASEYFVKLGKQKSDILNKYILSNAKFSINTIEFEKQVSDLSLNFENQALTNKLESILDKNLDDQFKTFYQIKSLLNSEILLQKMDKHWVIIVEYTDENLDILKKLAHSYIMKRTDLEVKKNKILLEDGTIGYEKVKHLGALYMNDENDNIIEFGLKDDDQIKVFVAKNNEALIVSTDKADINEFLKTNLDLYKQNWVLSLIKKNKRNSYYDLNFKGKLISLKDYLSPVIPSFIWGYNNVELSMIYFDDGISINFVIKE